MKLSPLRQLSDMPDDFEPTEGLATTLEQTEIALAEKILEAVAALKKPPPLQMQRHLSNLAALIAEHRQACGDLMNVETDLAARGAFDAGAESN